MRYLRKNNRHISFSINMYSINIKQKTFLADKRNRMRNMYHLYSSLIKMLTRIYCVLIICDKLRL